MSLFNQNLNAFGLDLSDRTIKVAQLKKTGEGLKLVGHNRKEIPEGIIKDGEIKKESKLVEIIQEAISESKLKSISTKFVIYSIPETKGFIRVIELPKTEKGKITEAIVNEAERSFPTNIKESYLDWQILPKNLADSANEKTEILVATASKNLVNSYSEALKKAGLKPVAAEIESVAIIRSLISEQQSFRPVLIIDLGKDRTSFIIFKKPAVQFTASIPVCGNEFNKAVAKEFSVSAEEAEKIKLECGLNYQKRSGRTYKAMLPSLVNLVGYIDKLLNYYQEHFSSEFHFEIHGDSLKSEHNLKAAESKPAKHKRIDPSISKVIICGGEAKIPGMTFYLSLQIKKEIERANPWINIITSDKGEIPPISRDDSLVFVTVLGLAMRGAGEY